MQRSSVRNLLAHKKRVLRGTAFGSISLLILGLLGYSHLFGPVDPYATTERLVITSPTTLAEAAAFAESEGIVASSWALRLALLEKTERSTVRAGEYTVSASMDAWTVAELLTKPPALAFVTFPPSLRKEQMGDILADALGWDDAVLKEWNTSATSPDPDFMEGVYFPDTYLLPSDQSPAQIAARLRGRFTDVFAPYAAKAQAQDIPWTDVLTLASIVDREASKTDKALVAGILWNRLDRDMRLQADATLQYIQGRSGNWWPQPKSADKFLESPFNTYKYAGLPPHPINNPTLASIEAVLDPESTSCLFYLHDNNHRIHCSRTYAEHEQNIDTYLR